MASLLEQFHTSEHVFKNATRQDLARAGLRQAFSPRSRLDSALGKEVERDLRWLEAPDHHLLRGTQDEAYPKLLAQIYDPPCLLFAAGNIAATGVGGVGVDGAGVDGAGVDRAGVDKAGVDRAGVDKAGVDRAGVDGQAPTYVAIVGSRNASRYGLQQARTIAEELTDSGVTVVSGLALGIDSAAHEGALEAQGSTLAILGTGCDEIYPRRHKRLAEKIMDKGLMISEFPLGTGVYPSNFPRRNRVITGMSKATLVIEAALRSGSLISAQLAMNEGREVMALPGMVTSKYARGCHKLIKDGAGLIEKSEDLLNELGIATLPAARPRAQLDELQRRVIESLAQEAKSVDVLSQEISIDISDLLVSLISLEILGLVYSDGGLYGLAIPGV